MEGRMMYHNYFVLVQRPDNGQIDTYRQMATDPIHAIHLTVDEFKERNSLRLPTANIVIIGRMDYDG